jgi:hypothetical protein
VAFGLSTKTGSLVLQDTSSDLMLSLPLAFLTAGHVATFAYVHEVLGMCFSGVMNITTLDGTPKRRDQPIVTERMVVTAGGEYLLSSGIVSGEASAWRLSWMSGTTSQVVLKQLSITTATEIQATRGPRFKHASRARHDVDTISTISHCSRSSINQVRVWPIR